MIMERLAIRNETVARATGFIQGQTMEAHSLVQEPHSLLSAHRLRQLRSTKEEMGMKGFFFFKPVFGCYG